MLKVGVIGCGGIGRTHAEVYHQDALSELVCVCDIDKQRADALANAFNVRAYYSVDDMLKNEQLDCVSVCTSGFENGGDHYEPTMQCLEANVHVLCEKPLSNRVDEAREMVRKAREKGLYLGTNLNHRFVPPAAKAKHWVDEGRLGELLLINMTMWIDNPNETSPWFHIRALHPHSIDIMRYYCGDVKRVHAFFKRAPGRVCWSNVQVNMEFENGVIGHLCGSYDANPRHNLERCEVMGTEGRFVLDNCYEELIFYPRRSDECILIRNGVFGLTGFRETFKTRIHRWLEQLTQQVPPEEIEASGLDGLRAQEIIEAAIKSFETSSIVEVEKG